MHAFADLLTIYLLGITRTAVTAVTNTNSNFRMIRDFSSVVLLDFLGENELLVLENPWESVKESLPDVLERKQYGV